MNTVLRPLENNRDYKQANNTVSVLLNVFSYILTYLNEKWMAVTKLIN